MSDLLNTVAGKHELDVWAEADGEVAVRCHAPGCLWSATWCDWEVAERLPKEQASHNASVRQQARAAVEAVAAWFDTDTYGDIGGKAAILLRNEMIAP